MRNTDTKIYVENHGGYFKFINGVLCYLHRDGKEFEYQSHLWLSQEPYIEVDEHDCVRQDAEDEPSEVVIGKLGWFYDEFTVMEKFIDVLARIDKEEVLKYVAKADRCHHEFFRPLTPEEVEKYTGYKVVKEA